MKDVFQCLMESIVCTILVMIAFYILPYTRQEFLILNLHPLLVIVAIMSIRYGTYLGFLSSFIAILGYLYAYLDSGNDMVLFLLKFQHYKFFLMFLFTALILGRFKDNFQNKEETFKKEVEKVVSVLNTEQEKNNQLLNINLALKDQIIRSKGSIVAFHYIKKQLLEKTNEDILEKVADILNQFLNAETISVYFLERVYTN